MGWRRRLDWFAKQSPGSVASACGAIAGGLDWIVSRSRPDGETLGLTVLGTLGGYAISLFSRWLARGRAIPAGAGDDLFDTFFLDNRKQIRAQWRELLADAKDRLVIRFSDYQRIRPPRSFSGSLNPGADLVSALESAATQWGGPRLLIVGPPGYGKTVALLDLALHLAEAPDRPYGAPVILNLGGWGAADNGLVDWMVDELSTPKGSVLDAEQVREWLTSAQITPILDGLDEVGDRSSRQRCVHAINDFLDGSPDRTALVVASRPDEYTEITCTRRDYLAVNAAIALQKLSTDDAAARLRETVAQDGLADVVESTPTQPVAQLLRIPVWLWMAETLGSENPSKLTAATSDAEAQEVLTDTYLNHSITTLAGQVSLDSSSCRRVLAAIVGFLRDPRSPDATTFRTEDLTPPVARRTDQRRARLFIGLSFGLVSGLGSGLVFGLNGIEGLSDALTVGLILGLVFGLVLGLIGWVLNQGPALPDARPTRYRIQWSGRSQIHKRDAGWLISSLIGGLYFLVSSWQFGGLVLRLISALGGALVGGLFHRLFYGLKDVERVVSTDIDEGRRASRTSMALLVGLLGVTFGVLGGLTMGLVGGMGYGYYGGLYGGSVLGLGYGLVGGVYVGMDNGGWYLVMQRRVRRQAKRHSLLPDDIASFLASAIDAGILRKTGGGVQFRHAVLADRLAGEAPKSGLADLRSILTSSPAPV